MAEIGNWIASYHAVKEEEVHTPHLPQPDPELPVAQPRQRKQQELDWPPGVAGHLAQAIYGNSARPVKTVAIAAALALLAGVCGRSWTTYTSAGLNLYIALVAKSGVGKEAIADAIPTLIKAALKEHEHNAPSFFTFRAMASGQGLMKFMADTPFACALHIDGEFGHNVQFMATDKTGPYATLRQQMTRMYSKSAPNSMAGGIQRASAEDSVEIDGSASYSVIGDTTPSTFYEALNGKMMADGFLSRFVVIEYEGPRPPLNENRQAFHPEAVKWFMMLVQQAVQRNSKEPTAVPVEPDALVVLQGFAARCDHNVNATEDETQRQLWSRAHLNALKIATLLSVADSWGVKPPMVTLAQAEWAIALVMRNVANMKGRLDGGDVGEGDSARERKLVAVLRHYLVNPVPASYKVPEAMWKRAIVPVSYLMIRTAQHAAFYNHRFEAKGALRDALRSMVDAGYLIELKKDAVIEEHGYFGQSYRILRLPDYDEGGNRP